MRRIREKMRRICRYGDLDVDMPLKYKQESRQRPIADLSVMRQ